MKKAKNVFAIIGISLAVVAAFLAIMNPWFDILAGRADALGDLFKPHLSNLWEGLKGVFTFKYFSDLGNNIAPLICLCLAGVGVILFIVLFILMLCKKHAKGLGWFFPMFLVYLLGAAVVGANRFNGAGYKYEFKFPQIVGQYVSYVAIAACALLLLAAIFYIAYVCEAGAKAKKTNDARQAAIAKIDALLGGNK